MNEYPRHVQCDFCGSGLFSVQDWETYYSVICTVCHKKLGKLRIGEG